MNLEMNVTDWNLVSEKGLPKDMTFCLVCHIIDRAGIPEYHWTVGGYSEENKNFYVNFGWGGGIIDEKDCYAWKDMDEVEIKPV